MLSVPSHQISIITPFSPNSQDLNLALLAAFCVAHFPSQGQICAPCGVIALERCARSGVLSSTCHHTSFGSEEARGVIPAATDVSAILMLLQVTLLGWLAHQGEGGCAEH